MNIAVDVGFINLVLLILCRVGTFFLLTPLFAITQVPIKIRMLFLLAVSVCLAIALSNFGYENSELTLTALSLSMLSELMIGAVMAFGVFTAFGAFLFGGRVIDFQMGFGVAGLIDPSTNAQAPLLGTVINMTAVLTFFLIDGHLLLIKSLAYSLEMHPPHSGGFDLDLDLLIKQFGLMFVYGMAVVAPVVFTLLLIDVGMAVAARTMPQVNMFIVSLPLKILVGLMIFALSILGMRSVFEDVYTDMFIYMDQLFSI